MVLQVLHGLSDRAAVQGILDGLPQWFGRPETNAEYAAAAERLPGYAAMTADGECVGVVLIEQHFPETAEIHLMAVKAPWHRQRIGRALLGDVEADLRDAGTRVMTVKTLGYADPDESYRRTRDFYTAMGFLPLEEFTDLWPDTPCLFMAKVLT